MTTKYVKRFLGLFLVLMLMLTSTINISIVNAYADENTNIEGTSSSSNENGDQITFSSIKVFQNNEERPWENCKSFERIDTDISNEPNVIELQDTIDPQNVTVYGYADNNVYKIYTTADTLYISNNMFANSSLESINLTGFTIDSNRVDTNTLFSGCYSLNNIIAPSTTFSAVSLESSIQDSNTEGWFRIVDSEEQVSCSTMDVTGGTYIRKPIETNVTTPTNNTTQNIPQNDVNTNNNSENTVLSSTLKPGRELYENWQNCTSIVFTDEDISTKYNAVELQESGEKCYGWNDHGVYKIYSTADVIYLNPDSYRLFYLCHASQIDLSKFDTSKVTNMSQMFHICSVTTLDLSKFDTSNVTNMSDMFNFCTKLTTLNVSNFNTSKVTDMSDMFWCCRSLTSLDLSNFNTSAVTDMSGMFYNCYNLTSLDLSNFDTSNVTDMSSMFCMPSPDRLYGDEHLSYLASINISSFNTQNVTNMNDMFSDCVSLTSLNLYNFDTSNVTSMARMFSGCSNLTSINMSSFNTHNVTRMYEMFSRCSSLTSIDVSNFDTSNVTDMGKMFKDCISLTSIDVSNFITDKVVHFGDMFDGCYNLTSLDISSFVITKAGNGGYEIQTSAQLFSQAENGNQYALTYIKSPKELNKYLYLPEGEWIIDNNDDGISDDELTYVNIEPGSVSNIYKLSSILTPDEPNSTTLLSGLKSRFKDCTSITVTDEDISTKPGAEEIQESGVKCYGWNDNGVYKIYSTADVIYLNPRSFALFEDCENLTSIDMTRLNTKKVLSMSHWFRNCKNLTSLDLSMLDTRNVASMNNMFSGCTELVSVNLSGFYTRRVVSVDNMFKDCKKLKTLDLSSFDLTNIGYTRFSSKSMFDKNYSLEYMKSPKKVPADSTGILISLPIPYDEPVDWVWYNNTYHTVDDYMNANSEYILKSKFEGMVYIEDNSNTTKKLFLSDFINDFELDYTPDNLNDNTTFKYEIDVSELSADQLNMLTYIFNNYQRDNIDNWDISKVSFQELYNIERMYKYDARPIVDREDPPYYVVNNKIYLSGEHILQSMLYPVMPHLQELSDEELMKLQKVLLPILPNKGGANKLVDGTYVTDYLNQLTNTAEQLNDILPSLFPDYIPEVLICTSNYKCQTLENFMAGSDVYTDTLSGRNTYIVSFDHDYHDVVDIAPTCTTTGKSHEECSICGSIGNTKDIPISHVRLTDVYVEPSCTEVGHHYVKCSDCGEVIKDEIINPLGHNEVWVTDIEPTTEHEGKKHLECLRCKEKLSEDVVIPKLTNNTPEQSKTTSTITNGAAVVKDIEEKSVPSKPIINEPIKPKEPTRVAPAVINDTIEDSNVDITNIEEDIHQTISSDVPEEPKTEDNKEDNKIYRFITETIVPIWNGIIETVSDNPSLAILPIVLVIGSGLFIFFIILPRKEDEDEEEDENEDNIDNKQ